MPHKVPLSWRKCEPTHRMPMADRRLLGWRECDQCNADNDKRWYVTQQMPAFARILEMPAPPYWQRERDSTTP